MSVYKITLLHLHSHSFQSRYIQARDIWVGALHPDYTCIVDPVDRLPPDEQLSDRSGLRQFTQGCADLAIEWSDEKSRILPPGNVLANMPLHLGTQSPLSGVGIEPAAF